MKIGYRPAATKTAALQSAPAIRIGLPLNRKPPTSDRAEIIDQSDWPEFLKGDDDTVPRRAAESDWTKPFGNVGD